MSTLPGIVHDQPDVFETEDPPAPPTQFEDDSSSSVVEKLPSGVSTSYGRFVGKSLNPRFVDFSDPNTHGMRTELSDYEKLLLNREEESITDRLERLKLEVAELQKDVSAIKEGSGGGKEKVNPVELASDVAELQKQLSTVSVDVAGHHSADRNQTMRYLLDHIETLKKGSSSGQGEGSKGVTYEIYCRESGEKTAGSGQLRDLADRLSKLESTVGATELKSGKVIPTGLLAYTSTKDLMSAVIGLQARVALLDQGQIVDADTKLKLLLSTLDKVNQHKSEPDEERSKKIDELYDLVKKWDSIRQLLPDLIDRLLTLKELHERGASLLNSVADIEASQNSIKAELTGLRDAMKMAQTSFAENLSTIQANFAALSKK